MLKNYTIFNGELNKISAEHNYPYRDPDHQKLRKKSYKMLNCVSPDETDVHRKKTAACGLSNFKFYNETNIFLPANRVKPKKSADARAVLTVPPLQIRLPKSLQHSDVKQEKFEDDESSGDSDEFNNSFDDKEELETYHNDSNLDEYEQKTT